jgi:hypothetical protein
MMLNPQDARRGVGALADHHGVYPPLANHRSGALPQRRQEALLVAGSRAELPEDEDHPSFPAVLWQALCRTGPALVEGRSSGYFDSTFARQTPTTARAPARHPQHLQMARCGWEVSSSSS